MSPNDYLLRAPEAHEFEEWFKLYHAFSVSVEEEVTPDIAQRVWNWINDPSHPTKAIVATIGGRMVGFTHYRPFPRTLHGNEACYLDDLFVHESERGSGLAQRLIGAVSEIAKEHGWTHVRWVTEEKNARARALYGKLATAMTLITYKLD